MSSPGSETAIRNILRHLRRADHELTLALDVGGFLVSDLSDCRVAIQRAAKRSEEELERLRRTT